ncbi:MAG TPA: helix-turn-helix transcriptional regulator [Ktedonobacteraceae bacterium]|nr:helix-turn-helix transcriptional regulator [Ktedonobacteraceae bacterium]
MREGQYSQLPVTILLATMRELHATVTLHAALASLPEGWNDACMAELVMVQGSLQSCTIRTMEGHQLLQQEAAFQMLERLGELEWRLQPSWPDESRLGQPPAAAPLSAVMLANCSQREKQVLLLAQGHKPPQEIARLLGLSPPQVELILETLAKRSVLRRHDERRSIFS